MPGNRIRGITVEIGGDVTKLDKALGSVNKSINTTQGKLKDVERLLKLDPKNVELLDQKQRLLAQSVEQTSDKLKTLKDAAESATVSNVKYEEWQRALKPLQAEITKTANVLSQLEKEQAKLEVLGFSADTSALADVQQRADAARQKLAGLQQEVIDTYDALGRPISIEQWDDIQREMADTAANAKDAQDAFDNFEPSLAKFSSTAHDVSDKAGKVADATKGISVAAGGLLTAMLGTVPATDEFRTDLSKLETNAQLAGVGLESTEGALKQLNAVSGETDSSVEALSNLLAAGVSENNLQKAVEGLAGAAISFPDTVKIESLADSLQETISTGEATGQFAEVLDRLGVGAEEFSAQLAQVPGETNKLNFALDTLANQGLGGVYDAWKENNEALIENKDATFEFQQSLAKLADAMTPLITTVTELASSFLDWFTGLSDGKQTAIVALIAIVAAISPVASAIASVSGAVGNVIDSFGKLKKGIQGVLGLFTNANPMVLAITAVIAALALLILNWDKVKETVKNVIDAIVGFIGKAVDAVKNFFSVLSGGEKQAAGGGRVKGASTYSLPAPLTLNDYPHFASGGVFAPNTPMLGVLGDNRTELEVAAPESTLRETFLDALSASGLSGRQNVAVTVRFTGDLAQLGRVLNPVITAEGGRLGPQLIGGQ